ncbi:protein Wnt-10a [Monomorium pharaonis]|uniref:protein Wnt-10a n=1 Tax=Monomorium pharaonis TaxID=307658 RepID=UPI00063FB408|nr:protein Wnt-10a [Monomorium pharaonis]
MPPTRTGRAYEGPPSKIATKIGLTIALLLIFLEHRRATCLMSNSIHSNDWMSSPNIVCNGIPGLTKDQRELCHRYPDVTISAMKGLQLAISECQHQFVWHRWNCSSLTPSSRTQQSSVLLQRGYRETAFAYAISAAGVAHNIARACSMGRLLSCSCDPSSYMDKTQPTTARDIPWKWGGCSHNLEYGMDFSKQFLDTQEKAGDIQSTVNLHNNQAGRLALASNMQMRCKCHGMSGSCELKTCWKIVPDFRVVGKALKDRFRNAILVTQTNLGEVIPSNRIRGSRRKQKQKQKQKKRRRDGRKKKIRDLPRQLYYYQKSPNFCEQDTMLDIAGTAGRRCNKTSTGGDGCASLCCGRGYNMVRQRRTERCRCKFHWCCFVQCENCTVEEWITVCK